MARMDGISGQIIPLPNPTLDNDDDHHQGKARTFEPAPPDNVDPDDPLTRLAMSSRLPVDRGVIRNVLLRGVKESITFNKSINHYTTSSTGVIAHFTDGSTSEEGSLLVGTDGFRSKVTKQLVGDLLQPIDLGTRMIYGKSPLTPELEKVMNKELKYGIRIVIDTTSRTDTSPSPAPVSLFIETCRYTHPSSPIDYVFWVLTDPSGYQSHCPDQILLTLQGEAAAEIASTTVAHFHPSVKIIIDHQDKALSSVWALTCAPPNGLPAWETDERVTILGDAVHPMPPTGGLAGNAAFRSAASLVHILARKQREDEKNSSGHGGNQLDGSIIVDGWGMDTIHGFEEKMRSEAGRMVSLSHAATTGTYPLNLWKPLHWNGWETLG